MVDEHPNGQPDQTNPAHHQKCALPPGFQDDPRDERRRNHGTDGGATVEDTRGERTLFGRKPLGNHFDGGGPVDCFAHAQ